jgi:acetyl-CoA carboxylase beta subunit
MKHFYTRKYETLGIMQDRITELRNLLEDLTKAEQGVSIGTIDEVSEMSDLLEGLAEQVNCLSDAVEPLAEAAERSGA